MVAVPKGVNFPVILFLLISMSELLFTSTFGKSISDCNCVCGVRGRGNRIVGGNAISPNEYPWLVGLNRQGKMYCGATVISHRHVLTAAHCVNGMEANEIRVYLGGHEISKDYTEIRRVKKIHEHEYFDIISFDHDIAVLELDKPIKFGPKVQPVCLPDGSRDNYTGALTMVAGWGRTEERGKTSDVVRSVQIPVWSPEQCHDAGYGDKRLTGNMMCGGYHDGGRDACQGDSGGPMILTGPTGSAEIIGIVSWGRGCARPNLPGIYTRLVNYLPWIQKKIAGQCLCQPKAGSRSLLTDGFFG